MARIANWDGPDSHMESSSEESSEISSKMVEWLLMHDLSI